MTSFIGDICEPAEDVLARAFEGVDCVFHCAALIDFQFPPNERELERVNVQGKYNPLSSSCSTCIETNPIDPVIHPPTLQFSLLREGFPLSFHLIRKASKGNTSPPF